MTGQQYRTMFGEIIDNGMLCAGRIANITHYVLQCGLLPGDMAEFGCHRGYAAALMALLVDKPLYLYDSFDGLPDRRDEDAGTLAHFKRGALAVEPQEVLQRFVKYGLREPTVYKGWFREIPCENLPDRLCFAHLDGDLYDSIMDGLNLIYPRLVPGGVCIIDDYGWVGTSGVKIAADEYMANKPEKVKPLQTGNPVGCHGVIVKI